MPVVLSGLCFSLLAVLEGCQQWLLHEHMGMRQYSRLAVDIPGCRKPGLVWSMSALAVQEDTGASYSDVNLGLLEGLGSLSALWSQGTFWYVISRLTCLHLSEARSVIAVCCGVFGITKTMWWLEERNKESSVSFQQQSTKQSHWGVLKLRKISLYNCVLTCTYCCLFLVLV